MRDNVRFMKIVEYEHHEIIVLVIPPTNLEDDSLSWTALTGRFTI